MFRIRPSAWLLPILVLATPMVLPLAGRDRSKPVKPQEPPESPEVAAIVYKVIAN
jgi:hypothetical protein